MRAARRITSSPPGAPVIATTTRSRVSHGPAMPCASRYVLERLVDPVGDPQQRELAQRAEVARRGSSWRARRRPSRAGRCCRAPSAAAAPRASCRRARSGRRARTTASGIVSLLLDPGDLLDDVVHRLEVLDVDRGDDVDARRRAAPRRPASASRCGEPGHVGVGELVDERDAPARGRGPRRRPSPRTSRRGTSIARRGTTSRSPICAAVFGRPWVSTNPTTTSVPRSRRRRPSLSIANVLPDAGRGAEVDAELAARHRRSLRSHELRELVEREVELEHVDRLLAEEAERPVRRCGRRSSSCTSRDREPALVGDARRLEPGVGDRDVRVEPGAGRGHRVDRHLRRRGEAVQLAVVLDPLLRPPSGSRGSSGRGSSRLLRRRVVARRAVVAGRRRAAAEGRDWKYSGADRPSCRERLADAATSRPPCRCAR